MAIEDRQVGSGHSRGTPAEWDATGRVLADGELGLVNQPDGSIAIIVGDGISTRSGLQTIGVPAGGVQTQLSVAVSGNTITLSWTGVIGATGYLVGRDGVDQYGTLGAAVQVGTSVTSWVFNNLSYGTAYTFSVQPLPNGQASTVKATTSTPPVGGTDTSLSVQAGDTQAVLTWTLVTGATGYLVGRDGTDSSGFGVWSTTDPASAVARTFNALINGTTYTLFVEPQGTAKPAYPTVGHGRKTITVTPSAGAPPAGQTVVSVSGITNTAITLNWTTVAAVTGYLVGRDGVDASGGGATQTTVGSGVLTQTFTNLVPGNPYTLFCTPQPGGQRKEITTATTVTGTDPGTPPAGTGTVWLSGTADDDTDNTVGGGFATWRGEPVTFARAWTDADLDNMVNMYMLQPYSTFSGLTIDVGIGGPGASGTNQTWASAASGGMDSIWRQQCQKINSLWGSLKCVHISMAHELNGGWFPWQVTNATAAGYFKQAWVRWYNIVTQELKSKGRNAKVVLNYNTGEYSWNTLWPGDAYVDIVGLDVYDMWMPTSSGNIRTQADWDGWVNTTKDAGTTPIGIGAAFTWAAGHNKPVTVPEWGLSPQDQFEHDNPFWIEKMREFFGSKAPADKDNPAAGKIAGDAYFNSWSQCRLYPSTTKPLAAAKYVSLKWGSTV